MAEPDWPLGTLAEWLSADSVDEWRSGKGVEGFVGARRKPTMTSISLIVESEHVQRDWRCGSRSRRDCGTVYLTDACKQQTLLLIRNVRRIRQGLSFVSSGLSNPSYLRYRGWNGWNPEAFGSADESTRAYFDAEFEGVQPRESALVPIHEFGVRSLLRHLVYPIIGHFLPPNLAFVVRRPRTGSTDVASL